MRTSGTAKALILVAAALVATGVLSQVPLSVDTSFRLPVETANVSSLAFMASGHLLLTGYMQFPDDEFERNIARVDQSGDRDPTYPYAYGVGKLTPWNDRFYVAGSQTVRRLLPEGLVDPSFIHMNSDPLFSSLQGGDYHVFVDGRVLMSGLHTLHDPEHGFEGAFNLIWFTNTGHLDTTRIHRNGNGVLHSFKQLPDGKFLCSGSLSMYDGRSADRIFRIHADGALDTTFRSHVVWGRLFGYHPLADGRVVVAGRFRLEGSTDTLHIARFLADGSLDPTFNNAIQFLRNSNVALDWGAVLSGLFPLEDGRLIVYGAFDDVEGEPRRAICMLDADGQLLNTYFVGAGCGAFLHFGITYDGVDGMAQAPDGDYYIWGGYHGYNDGTTNDTLQRMVTRLHGGELGLGVAPLTAGERLGLRVYPNPSSGQATLALEQVPPAAQVVVRDALGREVMRQRIGGYYTALSFTHTGVYMVELWSGQGRLAVERLVVE